MNLQYNILHYFYNIWNNNKENLNKFFNKNRNIRSRKASLSAYVYISLFNNNDE